MNNSIFRLAVLLLLWFCLKVENLGSADGVQGESSQTTSIYEAEEVVGKTPKELIELRGFLSEEFYAETVDGYLLQVIHLIHPQSVHKEKLKRPVLFNHGLFESATIWLISSRNIQPLPDMDHCSKNPGQEFSWNGTEFLNGPFMLANHGYDVWLMSMRGTEFSNKHITYTDQDPDYWNYCLDDFGLKDVPAVIDFVREMTGASKVAYIGHSQATFSVFALLSMRPEYADIIEPIFAVAPVAYMHHAKSVGKHLFVGTLFTTDHSKHGSFPGSAGNMRTSFFKICDKKNSSKLSLMQFLCDLIQELVNGKGEKWLSGYYSHLPFRTSLKVLRQFGELIHLKRFAMYSYGEEENMKIYGQKESPAYPVEQIRSKKLVLISSFSDALSPPADVNMFKTRLKVPIYRDIFINENFNHFDLIIHKRAGNLVFGPILEILEEVEHKNGICSVQKPTQEDENHTYQHPVDLPILNSGRH